jgi:Lysozyme inhibitor LprI
MPARRLKWSLAAIGLLAIATVAVRAEPQDSDADAAQTAGCESVKNLALPPADAPSAVDRAALKGCDSEALYFGIGVTKDPARARQCAYLEREDPDKSWPNLYSGNGMLMMIYANGIGAPRNLDLALKFACEINGAPAEEEGWVAHLKKLKEENWKGQDFSPCEDITSGAAQGFCAAHEGRLAEVGRKAKLAKLIASWSKGDRKAFATLEKAKNDYVTAEADNEVDMSGTARGAFYIEAERAEEDRFLALLQELIKGDAPSSPKLGFSETDAKLNTLYQKIQNTQDASEWGTVTKDGIKTTQRVWLRYRDAWVDFAKIKFPSLAPDRLKTILTEDRIKLLKNFVD